MIRGGMFSVEAAFNLSNLGTPHGFNLTQINLTHKFNWRLGSTLPIIPIPPGKLVAQTIQVGAGSVIKILPRVLHYLCFFQTSVVCSVHTACASFHSWTLDELFSQIGWHLFTSSAFSCIRPSERWQSKVFIHLPVPREAANHLTGFISLFSLCTAKCKVNSS